MVALSQAGLVLYTPAFLQISQQLHISTTAVKATITAYLLGFGVSQLIYGPLSDHFGRKKPLIIGMIIFCIGCLWSVFSDNYINLFLSRIIQGLGVGATMTLSRSILRDHFSGIDYIKYGSYLSSGFAAGLGITPLIGGHLLSFFSWRSEFVFLFIIGVLLTIIFVIFLPETHPPAMARQPIKVISKTSSIHFYNILKNFNFICYLIGGVLAYGVVISYSTMTPFIFQKTLNYSPAFYGWLTFIVAIFYYAATAFNRRFVATWSVNNMMRFGLILILIPGIAMLLSKLLFNAFNIYVIFIPMAIAIFGQALIWSNSVTGALKDLAHIAGTAAALFSCLQMVLSAIISALIAIPNEQTQIPLAIVLIILGAISWLIFQISIFKDK